ncbi:MAG: hypothetical protein GY714_22925 [Desulfobacterales bacterium]|nr:hypothetical protein [Desulfobacterales bacterium]MCP4160248.1 hypothetical protein [Deltaproteobacteria bacterium]
MKLKLLICVLFFVFLSSCFSIKTMTKGSFIRLIPNTKPEITFNEESASKIEVFYQKKPNFEYIEIGIIESIAYGGDVGLKDLFPELKKQAFLAGGEAIHKIQLKRHNQTGDTLHATAVAIVRKLK